MSREIDHPVGASYVRTIGPRIRFVKPYRPIEVHANGADHQLAIAANAAKMRVEMDKNLSEMYQAQFEAGMITLEELQSLTRKV